jgi:hypothetical protein
MLKLCLFCLPLWAYAAPDAESLLNESDRARGGHLPGLSWSIGITSLEEGKTDSYQLVAKASGANTRVEYTAPQKSRGQVVLMLGRNMWFSRPGLQKPIPISPRQRLTGQAANGDIAATDYSSDYDARLLSEEELDGTRCAVLELTAKARNVTYDRIRYWVALERKVGLKAEFYTVSGKLMKWASFEYGGQIAFAGRRLPFVSRMTIRDAVNAGNVTTLDYANVSVKKLNPELFELAQ